MLSVQLLKDAAEVDLLVHCAPLYSPDNGDCGYIICDRQNDYNETVFDADLDFVSQVVVLLRGGHFEGCFFVAVVCEEDAVITLLDEIDRRKVD